MEFKAKTVDEAVAMGLESLNLSKDEAEIIVIEEPTRGLFGRLKGQAVVQITKKESLEELVDKKAEETPKEQTLPVEESDQKALELTLKVLEFLGFDAKGDVKTTKDRTVITLNTEKPSSLIGHRGEVIDALQTLAGAMANVGKKNYKKVVVDCENYRDKREDTLVKLAHKLEQKATEIRREVILEPMSPFERRIIHTALADSQTVTTTSNGKEPNRYVVIVPNDKDEFSKPYNAGRNNDRNRNSKGSNYGRRDERPRRDYSARRTPSKKQTKISFGTYLGNSLKDKD